MEARREDVIYIVEEFEHEGGGRVFRLLPKAFASWEAADAYARERCLSYSEECLWAYDSYKDGLDDPTEATLRITPVVVGSKEPVTKIDDMIVM
ncbi:MAG: hypothetical protein IJC63_01215 [Myxococcaceae bacterium]|nr:hypothetical protein [Myxococcaceae bacterium]